jgi:hypothetical protein
MDNAEQNTRRVFVVAPFVRAAQEAAASRYLLRYPHLNHKFTLQKKSVNHTKHNMVGQSTAECFCRVLLSFYSTFMFLFFLFYCEGCRPAKHQQVLGTHSGRISTIAIQQYSIVEFFFLFSLQTKYVGTGHSDMTKYEWATNQHRDTVASHLGHYDLLSYMAVAQVVNNAGMPLVHIIHLYRGCLTSERQCWTGALPTSGKNASAMRPAP